MTKPRRKHECKKKKSGEQNLSKINKRDENIKYNDKSGYNGGLWNIKRDITQRKHTPWKATQGIIKASAVLNATEIAANVETTLKPHTP